MNWRIPYIIRKLLKPKCLKWTRMTHWGTWNTSYGQKKSQESNYQKSNYQFYSQPLKIENRPNFLVCKWHTTYHWKAPDEGYNSVVDLTSIEGLHTKLCTSKVTRVSILGISKLPFGNPRTKWHLNVNPMAKHR